VSILKATRRHYAALQHRPGSGRIAIDYEVTGQTAGTIWVKAATNAQRKGELTRLLNRLRAMYPCAQKYSAEFRDRTTPNPMREGRDYFETNI
jgi:hypothetical protein